jgi:hypothetical protein
LVYTPFVSVQLFGEAVGDGDDDLVIAGTEELVVTFELVENVKEARFAAAIELDILSLMMELAMVDDASRPERIIDVETWGVADVRDVSGRLVPLIIAILSEVTVLLLLSFALVLLMTLVLELRTWSTGEVAEAVVAVVENEPMRIELVDVREFNELIMAELLLGMYELAVPVMVVAEVSTVRVVLTIGTVPAGVDDEAIDVLTELATDMLLSDEDKVMILDITVCVVLSEVNVLELLAWSAELVVLPAGRGRAAYTSCVVMTVKVSLGARLLRK